MGIAPLTLAVLAVNVPIVYAWAIFPALLAWLSRKPLATRPDAADNLPHVALVISAYNEERHIGERVRNLLTVEYPADRWRAFIGVDGCKDRTAAKARAAAAGHANITVLEFEKNRGKVAVLKDLVARVRSDAPEVGILVFSDANTDFHPAALGRLVAPFGDPTVGGVCGKLVFAETEGSKTDENVYWKLENWLKARESDIDSCLGANGAIYAIRTPLFWNAIPPNTIIDDFVIGMKIREQGHRMVYERNARAVEELPPDVRDEWTRRVRIGAGNFQALGLCAGCLSPSLGAFAWVFWSHKVLRWLTPHFMIAGFALSAAAAATGSPAGMLFAGLYGGLAIAALAGRAVGGKSSAARLLRGVHYLVLMQAALFAGFLRFCRGNLEGRWQRTTR